MEIYKKQTLSETFSVYFDKRMIRILLLGIISGFPWVLIGSSLSLWLKATSKYYKLFFLLLYENCIVSMGLIVILLINYTSSI